MDMLSGRGAVQVVERTGVEMAAMVPMPALDLSFSNWSDKLVPGSDVPCAPEMPEQTQKGSIASRYQFPLHRAIEILLQRDITQTYHPIALADSRMPLTQLLRWQKRPGDEVGRIVGPARNSDAFTKEWLG